jgi:hypothetical protein
MGSKIKVGAALLLLLVVVYIFVLPAFNLDPTALRAAREIGLIFIGMAAAASALSAPKSCTQSARIALVTAVQPSSHLIDLTCARLC